MASRCAIHCSWLLDDWRELVLDILNDARADRLFDLLGEHAALVLVVLQPHCRDLVRCLAVFEVLQRPALINLKPTLASSPSFN